MQNSWSYENICFCYHCFHYIRNYNEEELYQILKLCLHVANGTLNGNILINYNVTSDLLTLILPASNT